jgi:hypothetical protein
MPNGDWFPKTEQDLVDLIDIWDPILANSAKRTEYGWDADACAATGSAMGAFKGSREAYHQVDSSTNRDKKDEAYNACDASVRDFAATYIRPNKKMTDWQKKEMGVHVASGTHAPKPDPKDHVGFKLTTDAGDHSVSAEFWIEGQEGETKSKGDYHAAEGRYWILPKGEKPPIDGNAEGGTSVASTSNPWNVKPGGEHSGEMFHLTMRWENESTGKKSGEAGKGPWSAFQSIMLQ